MRIKLIKNHRLGKAGDIVTVSNNVGFGLMDGGYGKLTKDMVESDYKTKTLDEEQANGKHTIVRPNFSGGRKRITGNRK